MRSKGKPFLVGKLKQTKTERRNDAYYEKVSLIDIDKEVLMKAFCNVKHLSDYENGYIRDMVQMIYKDLRKIKEGQTQKYYYGEKRQ